MLLLAPCPGLAGQRSAVLRALTVSSIKTHTICTSSRLQHAVSKGGLRCQPGSDGTPSIATSALQLDPQAELSSCAETDQHSASSVLQDLMVWLVSNGEHGRAGLGVCAPGRGAPGWGGRGGQQGLGRDGVNAAVQHSITSTEAVLPEQQQRGGGYSVREVAVSHTPWGVTCCMKVDCGLQQELCLAHFADPSWGLLRQEKHACIRNIATWGAQHAE
jgi:hypothetical protein